MSSPGARPIVSVVVPVYNGGDEIVDNVETIHAAVSRGLRGDDFELIVVSDGSIDATAERLLERAHARGTRVIHYDRNLGKGYAIKTGALGARGQWVAFVDADLDLDPTAIPQYLERARTGELDFAIGSKRHPGSAVQYPRSRRVASWCYQQLNRLLFRLDVRDTQVGLKVMSRRVVDDVVPLLLVKQFAFDLELLAVATALGYDRVEELPVRLDYRFTGSALRSAAVVRALWDTFAIFYRLRLLRTYQRKRGLVGARSARHGLPLVSVVGPRQAATGLDYPRLEHAPTARAAGGELLAVLRPGARPAGNWVSAAVPYFADPGVAAVVTPTVAPLRAPLRQRLAAAVLESHLGGGSRRSTFFPGNLRTVSDYAADNVVIRRDDYLAAEAAHVGVGELVGWLAAKGRRTIYTPDTSIAATPAPLVGSHLRSTFAHGVARGNAARRTHGASLSLATALSLAPAAAGLVGVALLVTGGATRTAGLALLLAYAAVLVLGGAHAAARFRSLAVGILEPPAVVVSQGAYLAGFVRGLVRRGGGGGART